MQSILTRKQTQKHTKLIKVDGKNGRIDVEIRYDDECRNGRNTFAITGSIFTHETLSSDKFFYSGGCIHEEIYKHFPQFRHLIKWHLVSSDGPLHYVANTIYHARDRSHEGVEIGEPVKFNTKLRFKGVAFTFEQQATGFWDYLNSVGDFNNITVETIGYDGDDSYLFGPNYSLTGFIKENEIKKWYKAPFKNLESAEEFLQMLQTHKYEFIKIPVEWCKPVEPNIEAARSCAIWHDATLEQLQNKALLLARLPELLEAFKSDIEKLGFIY